ncbi:MAG: hypothetical protein WCI41_02855 [bacterium]
MFVLLQWLGGFIAMFANRKMYHVIKNDEKHQNFTSWSLWFVFDTIVAISTINADGNWILSLVYSISSLAVIFMIARKDGFQIHLMEIITMIVIIFISVMLWIFTNNVKTIIVCTIAIAISSIPQIKNTWQKPNETPTVIYIYFAFAELLSFLGGESWQIKDKFYPGVEFVLCLFIILLSVRKVRK